jgi:4-hydroxy-4-methyl-2-oxoglutarate aldolase
LTGDTLQVAGDEDTGQFSPPVIVSTDFRRLDLSLLSRLASLPGLTGTASDVLDGLGFPLVASAGELQPRAPGVTVAGHAVTLRYLPERRKLPPPDGPRPSSRLAHLVAFGQCSEGDVLVIDACGIEGVSTFGGIASLAARRAGLRAIVVDGAIRDVDEIQGVGLPAWSRSVTPRTGKGRLEAVSINTAVCCAGQQVLPGDLVLADASGVCFVPNELVERATEAIIAVAGRERDHLQMGTMDAEPPMTDAAGFPPFSRAAVRPLADSPGSIQRFESNKR